MFREGKWLGSRGHKLDSLLRRQLLKAQRAAKNIRSGLAKRSVMWLPVIVRLAPGVYASGTDGRRWEETMRRLGGRLKFHLALVDGFSGYLPLETISALAARKDVLCIHGDYRVKTNLDVASPAVLADAVWVEGFMGKGITVAVVDIGVGPHPDLTKPTQRLVAFADLVNNRTEPYDDDGHGTPCAGDVAGNGYVSGGKYRGPAWEASLVGVKVLDKYGSGLASTIIAGIQWCLDNRERYGIRIISLSLGDETEGHSWDDPLCRAVEGAWAAGVTVSVAVGNAGPSTRTIPTPGIAPSVLTAGVMNDGPPSVRSSR